MRMDGHKEGLTLGVLDTVTYVAPKVEDFQFVKYRRDGEVVYLTLDRPEHNLLNERMLAELATGINSLGEQNDIKLIVLDSAAKAFCGGIELGEYTQRRVFQLLDAFHSAFSRHAGHVETGAGGRERAGVRRRSGTGGAGRPGDCDAQRARFAQPEIKLGVFPPLAAAILPYIVGPEAGSGSWC